MKTSIGMLFLAVWPCIAQTTNVPASAVPVPPSIGQGIGDDPLLTTATEGLTASLTKPGGVNGTLIYYGNVGKTGNTIAWLKNGKLMSISYPALGPNDVRRLLLKNDQRWVNSEKENTWVIPNSATRAEWDGKNLAIYIDPAHYQTEAEAKAKSDSEKAAQVYSHQFTIYVSIFQITKREEAGVLAYMGYRPGGNYGPVTSIDDSGKLFAPDKDAPAGTYSRVTLVFIKDYPSDGLHPGMFVSARVTPAGNYTYTTLLGGDENTVPKFITVPPEFVKQDVPTDSAPEHAKTSGFNPGSINDPVTSP